VECGKQPLHQSGGGAVFVETGARINIIEPLLGRELERHERVNNAHKQSVWEAPGRAGGGAGLPGNGRAAVAPGATHEIDTRLPLDHVVAKVLEIANQ
jgi:hypothetical protein